MPSKTPSMISVILTILTLLVIGIALFFINVVTLNGFNGREGAAALSTSGICGSIGIILSAILAGKLSKLFIDKYNWNSFLAVVSSVIVSLIAGGVIFGIAFVLSLIVAEALFFNWFGFK